MIMFSLVHLHLWCICNYNVCLVVMNMKSQIKSRDVMCVLHK